jgi:RNA polymerase sigma factor (sigma-70 family)
LSTQDKREFVAGMAAKYSDRLRRFLKFRLPNPSDVPDLAQEVFMRLLRAPHHEDIRSPEAYLFTVANHVIQQHHQKQVTVSAPLEWIEALAGTALDSSEDPAAKVYLHQRLDLLERSLDELPPRVAMAFIMHRLQGAPIERIARELGIAQITVKKHLARALVHCRIQEQRAFHE